MAAPWFFAELVENVERVTVSVASPAKKRAPESFVWLLVTVQSVNVTDPPALDTESTDPVPPAEWPDSTTSDRTTCSFAFRIAAPLDPADSLPSFSVIPLIV